MPFLVLREVTANNEAGDTANHRKGAVVSDFELSEAIRAGIKSGQSWYRQSFEPLTDDDAKKHRIRATVAEGMHLDGADFVAAPWEDYVGLHPMEIQRRMDQASPTEVAKVRAYERGGLARPEVLDYTPPCEREPFVGYEELSVREIVAKLDQLSGTAVQDVIAYEVAHRARPAVVTYEPAVEQAAA